MFQKKYRQIIIAVSLFFLLVVSVLGLNVYISFQLEASAERVNIAGRQRMLSQRIAKTVESGVNAVLSGQTKNTFLGELESSAKLFDTTLTGFAQGGEVQSTLGQEIYLNAAGNDAGRDAVGNGQQYWLPFKNYIDVILDNANPGNNVAGTADVLSKAELQLGENNKVLLGLMNELTSQAQLEKNTELVNIVGRQRMLSQRVTKALFELDERFSSASDYKQELGELISSTRLFDQTLAALGSGGEVIDTRNNVVQIQPMSSELSRTLIAQANELWQPIAESLADLAKRLNSPEIANQLVTISQARNYSAETANKILTEMNLLTSAVEQEGSSSAAFLRAVQAITVAAALLLFAYIMYQFLVQVRRSDAAADAARKETRKILETVDQGLFLIGEDKVLGDQYSAQMEEIFAENNISGRSFSDFLRNIVSDKDLATANSYFRLMFDKRKKQRLLGDLNPLKQVAVQVPDKNDGFIDKYLKFSFRRVETETGEIDQVLGNVSDISREVKLAQELEAAEKRNSQQLEILSTVLSTNIDLVPLFSENTEQSLDDINAELRKNASSRAEYIDKANHIFAKIHAIKGESSALGLEWITEECQLFENKISALTRSDVITGKDFLDLTVSLENMIDYNRSLKELLEHLSSVGLAGKDITLASTDSRVDWGHLHDFADEVAERNGKKVELILMGLNDTPMNGSFVQTINMVATQMIRNAVSHGIETPERRVAINKTQRGRLTMSLAHYRNGGYQLTFADDGAGLDLDALVNKAEEHGIVSEDQVSTLSQAAKTALMFHPQLSSADSADQDKGQGIGLYAVKERIAELGGSISIGHSPGSGVRFTIKLPETCNQVEAEALTSPPVLLSEVGVEQVV